MSGATSGRAAQRCRTHRVLGLADRGQQLVDQLLLHPLLRLDANLLSEQEFPPLPPPGLPAVGRLVVAVDHGRPAHRPAAVGGLDRVGHPIRHRRQPLAAQELVLQEAGDDRPPPQIVPPKLLDRGGRLAAPPDGLELGQQLLEHTVRHHLVHRHVRIAGRIDEMLHILHQRVVGGICGGGGRRFGGNVRGAGGARMGRSGGEQKVG